MSDKPSNTPLTSKQQRQIKTLIQGWTTKFGWAELVSAIKSKLEIEISRQSLNGYVGIKKAYTDKKAEFRGVTPDIVKRITMSDVDLLASNEKLKKELKSKEETIELQLAMIRRILANAQSIPNINLNDLMRVRND
jgi:hypothetical protein